MIFHEVINHQFFMSISMEKHFRSLLVSYRLFELAKCKLLPRPAKVRSKAFKSFTNYLNYCTSMVSNIKIMIVLKVNWFQTLSNEVITKIMSDLPKIKPEIEIQGPNMC